MRVRPGRKPRGKLKSGDQARGIGATGAGDVEGGAVIGWGADERQAESQVDRVIESQRAVRYQRLVVVQRKRHVVARARGLMEQRVRGRRAARIDSLGLETFDGGTYQRQVLVAERAI